MSIRAAALAQDSALTDTDWRRRLDELFLRAAAEIRERRSLAQAFAQVASWPDPHRRLQARARLTELALANQGPPTAWGPLFASAAGGLLAALEEDPREPLLLNYAGVLLYELGATAEAERLFRAAVRLDPALPHAQDNLAAARARRRRPSAAPPALRALVSPLLGRARAVAGRARPAQGLTLSLCMIVRDEEEMLPGCLEPVAPYVDEIVVVDTGSTDRTVEIAERYGAKVVRFPWNGSFADARNVSLDHASGDWILYLDADEHMVAEDAPLLRSLLGRTWREGFHLVWTNYTGGDETGPAVTHLALRLFRNRPQYRFEGRIHEQKTQRMPTYLPERFETVPIRVLHYGYLKGRISEKDKSRRNLELLEREQKEAPSPFTAFNLGSEYVRLGETARARECFEQAWQGLGEGWTTVGYASLLVSRLASVRRASGDLEGARAAIEAGLAAFPDHTDLVLELAFCAWQEGNLAEAERLARRCLEMGDAPAQYVATVGSGTYLALGFLAELRRAQGDAPQAEALWRRSLREYPDYLAPVLPLVSSLVARGVDDGEIAALLPKERPGAMLLAGIAYLEAGRSQEAEAWFRRVLERQPTNPVAHVGLLEALLSRRRYAEVVALARTRAPEEPLGREAASAELFASALLGREELAQALERARQAGVPEDDRAFYAAFGKARRGGPPPPSLPAACAATAETVLEALLRVQEISAFEACLGVYERVAVDSRKRRQALAGMYLRRGFLDSAAEEWLALARERPDATSLIALAQLAYARGLLQEALDLAEGALDLEPEHEQAKRLRDALRLRLGWAAA